MIQQLNELSAELGQAQLNSSLAKFVLIRSLLCNGGGYADIISVLLCIHQYILNFENEHIMLIHIES